MTTKAEFEARFPGFTGHAYDFSDPPPGCEDDEAIARRIRSDLPDHHRLQIFTTLAAEAPAVAKEMERHLDAFREYTNKDFADAAQARAWLLPLILIWEEEAARLRKKAAREGA